MMLNGWAYAYITVLVIRILVSFYHFGKGNKTMPLTTKSQHGGNLLFKCVLDGLLIAGALGAYS